MASIIKIKRSSSTAAPSSALQAGELAYSFNSSKLFIGDGSANDIIGGELYVNMLDHTAGTLTASSAILVDSSSKIDQLKTANLTIGANNITAGSGDIDLVAAGNLDLDLTGGTIDTSSQATEIKLIDNNSAAFVFKSSDNTGFIIEIFPSKQVAGSNLDVLKAMQSLKEQAMAKVSVLEGSR